MYINASIPLIIEHIPQCFICSVKKQNAEQLRTEMSSSDPKPLLETFDIKLSTTIASAGQGTGRHKLDLRLMHRGGRLEVILLKQNETKVVTFDVLNLHRYAMTLKYNALGQCIYSFIQAT